MTVLASKEIRDDLGIDSLERGIVYALLLLRAANISPDNPISKEQNPYYNAVRISLDFKQVNQDSYQATLIGEVKIPYQSHQMLRDGANILAYLGIFGTSQQLALFDACPASSGKGDPLPDEPDDVDTLEKYLFWATQKLSASLLPDVSKVGWKFFEEDPQEPSVKLTYLMPIDLKLYALTNNLVGSTLRMVSEYVSD